MIYVFWWPYCIFGRHIVFEAKFKVAQQLFSKSGLRYMNPEKTLTRKDSFPWLGPAY